MQRRFLGLMTIGNQAAHQVDQEIRPAAMPRVLNLREILELVDERFDQTPLPQEQFVCQGQQAVFHVALDFGNHLNAQRLL